MWILTLQQQLTQQLASLDVDTIEEIVELRAEINIEHWQPLTWLKAQAHFPHFFWQHRHEPITFVTLGAVRHFSCLKAAELFSQKYHVRLFGGIKFEGQSQFILPRLSLAKQKSRLVASLYLDTAHLTKEKIICEEFIHSLAQFIPHQDVHTLIIGSKTINDFNRWQHMINQALESMQQNHLRKVVLANATQLTLKSTLNPYDLLYASQQKNLGCYHFLWNENGSSTFFGSSPERLYQRQERQLLTEALAGTVTVGLDPNETERNALWLLSDAKNLYENQLVVDDICQHLQDCVEQITVGETEIKRLPHVQHLRRPIQATLHGNIKDSDCLKRIQPTAAVAGLPRPNALAFIAEHEGFQREWYAGTLGYLQPEQAEFCVALRCARLEQSNITLYAGAGIVEGSTAQAEWQEIARKNMAMKMLLGG